MIKKLLIIAACNTCCQFNPQSNVMLLISNTTWLSNARITQLDKNIFIVYVLIRSKDMYTVLQLQIFLKIIFIPYTHAPYFTFVLYG